MVAAVKMASSSGWACRTTTVRPAGSRRWIVRTDGRQDGGHAGFLGTGAVGGRFCRPSRDARLSSAASTTALVEVVGPATHPVRPVHDHAADSSTLRVVGVRTDDTGCVTRIRVSRDGTRRGLVSCVKQLAGGWLVSQADPQSGAANRSRSLTSACAKAEFVAVRVGQLNAVRQVAKTGRAERNKSQPCLDRHRVVALPAQRSNSLSRPSPKIPPESLTHTT